MLTNTFRRIAVRSMSSTLVPNVIVPAAMATSVLYARFVSTNMKPRKTKQDDFFSMDHSFDANEGLQTNSRIVEKSAAAAATFKSVVPPRRTAQMPDPAIEETLKDKNKFITDHTFEAKAVTGDG